MGSKKFYLGVAIFSFIFLLLLIFLSYLVHKKTNQSRVNNRILPTRIKGPNIDSSVITLFPTLTGKESPQTLDKYDYSFLRYKYPIKYKDLVIDLSTDKTKMVVYYSSEEKQAKQKIKEFFQGYGFTDPIETNLSIFFIGLKQDKSEPPAGFFRD